MKKRKKRRFPLVPLAMLALLAVLFVIVYPRMAARSQTLSTPTVFCTKFDGVKLPGSERSSSAE